MNKIIVAVGVPVIDFLSGSSVYTLADLEIARSSFRTEYTPLRWPFN